MPAVKCANCITIPNKEIKPIHRLDIIYMSLANHKLIEKNFLITFHISLCHVIDEHKDHSQRRLGTDTCSSCMRGIITL